jgi:hypothetical protein
MRVERMEKSYLKRQSASNIMGKKGDYEDSSI